MHSLLYRAPLIAAVLVLVLRWTAAAAQPAAVNAPTTSDPSATARKLTNDAIAAQDAKDYATALRLYKQAYALVPHPILLFNVGQTYMLAGDTLQAERFFRHYLEREPNGPGAPTAREFLAALPSSPPPPPQPPSSRPTPSLTAEPSRPAPEAKGTSEVTPRSPAMEAAGSARPDAREAQLERATYLKIAGTTAICVGLTLSTITALEYGPLEKTSLAIGVSAAALAATFGGAVLIARGEHQQRAAQKIAWSPMIGSGFAGVAWSGALP